MEIKIILLSGLGAGKSGLSEAVNYPNMTLAVSPNYLSDEPKFIFSLMG